MIIHSAKDEPFCLRVQYSHNTDVLMSTKETEKFMQDFKSTFRVRKSSSMIRLGKKQVDYNKYYINPEQRYMKTSTDPKKDVANLKDEHFLYKNLHNHDFHNWKHPFEIKKAKVTAQNVRLSQKDIKELIKFKTHMEKNKKARLPALVTELL